jgi:hypothetical protein
MSNIDNRGKPDAVHLYFRLPSVRPLDTHPAINCVEVLHKTVGRNVFQPTVWAKRLSNALTLVRGDFPTSSRLYIFFPDRIASDGLGKRIYDPYIGGATEHFSSRRRNANQ